MIVLITLIIATYIISMFGLLTYYMGMGLECTASRVISCWVPIINTFLLIYGLIMYFRKFRMVGIKELLGL